MYEKHFGFKVKPFAITPDPEFLFPSRQHGMAMTLLEYGLESHAAFSLLTGEIGSGKTTLVRRLIRQIGDQMAVGLITHTHTRFKSVHPWAVSALNIVPADDTNVAFYEALVDYFVREYAKGRRTLLILDEAQNLSVPALEDLRLLSNVNSEKDVILQILLVGQPELREKLSQPELRQFAQRISVDYHLRRLDSKESQEYVRHRLQMAGGDPRLMSPEAIELIHDRTQGVPRLINQLCDFALLYAFADGHSTVDADVVSHVLHDRANVVALALPKGDVSASSSRAAI